MEKLLHYISINFANQRWFLWTRTLSYFFINSRVQHKKFLDQQSLSTVIDLSNGWFNSFNGETAYDKKSDYNCVQGYQEFKIVNSSF